MRWAAQYNVLREAVLSSPATHEWIREMIVRLEGKDPVDVLKGLEVLTKLMRMRHEAGLAGEWDQLDLQRPIGEGGNPLRD